MLRWRRPTMMRKHSPRLSGLASSTPISVREYDFDNLYVGHLRYLDTDPLAYFNPRARVGRDETAPAAPNLTRTFQSTRPRGARRGTAHFLRRAFRVSIHAPAWGATRSARQFHRRFFVSIHAPAWGATAEGILL